MIRHRTTPPDTTPSATMSTSMVRVLSSSCLLLWIKNKNKRTGRRGITMAEPRVEVRLVVDPAVGPLADGHDDEITVLVIDQAGVWAELVLPIDAARSWAGDLFAAVTAAHRDTTGDPHARSDRGLAALPHPDTL